jgi:hypothetical protein
MGEVIPFVMLILGEDAEDVEIIEDEVFKI